MKAKHYCISFKTRKKLYIGIKILSQVCTLVCVVYLGVVVYSLYRHNFMLHVLMISLFLDLYKNLIALGLLLFLLSIVCAKLNLNLKNQPTNRSLPRTHRVWVGLTLLTLLSTGVCSSYMESIKIVVDAEVGPRLKHGLSRYMEAASWGSALDRVQSFLHCCGVHGPADWYATTWIPVDKLSGQNVDNKLVQPNGRVQVPLVPSSCCRVVSAECGHKAWMDTKNRSWGDIRPADKSLLHSAGCEGAIKAAVARDLYIFWILLLIILILQILLVVASRLLYSSTINSVMLGRPQEKAPGWIIGPRLFRTKDRYGYLQEYDNRCQRIHSAEDSESSPSRKKKWKCIKKLRCRKTDNESDSGDTKVKSGKKKRFRSPCLARLKKSCSKKFRKKKDKTYITVESESDLSPGGKTEKQSDRESELGLQKKKKSDVQHFDQQQHYRVDAEVKGHPFATTGSGVKSKASSLEKTKQVFTVADDLTRRQIFEKTPRSEIADYLEPKKRDSGIVNDFQKKRELFESAARRENKSESGKADNVLVVQSVNLIDLDGVESVKTLSMAGTSATEISGVSGVKFEVKPPPAVLKNYPPLSPPK